MSRPVTQCPVCDAPLRVTELSCTRCETKLHGAFAPPPLARLSAEHQQFITTFVLCRGVIRDVERALGVSYPTVRARLDAALTALEGAISAGDLPAHAPPVPPRPAAPPPPELSERRRELLRQVQNGALDPAEAAEALRRLSQPEDTP